jgi:hypothetical protein
MILALLVPLTRVKIVDFQPAMLVLRSIIRCSDLYWLTPSCLELFNILAHCRGQRCYYVKMVANYHSFQSKNTKQE